MTHSITGHSRQSSFLFLWFSYRAELQTLTVFFSKLYFCGLHHYSAPELCVDQLKQLFLSPFLICLFVCLSLPPSLYLGSRVKEHFMVPGLCLAKSRPRQKHLNIWEGNPKCSLHAILYHTKPVEHVRIFQEKYTHNIKSQSVHFVVCVMSCWNVMCASVKTTNIHSCLYSHGNATLEWLQVVDNLTGVINCGTSEFSTE